MVALIAAMALQYAIPLQYTVVPRWPLISLEALLLATLTIINPVRLSRSTQLGKAATLALLIAITCSRRPTSPNWRPKIGRGLLCATR